MDHCRVCGQHIDGTYCGEGHAMAAARIEAETVDAIVSGLRSEVLRLTRLERARPKVVKFAVLRHGYEALIKRIERGEWWKEGA